MPLTALLAQLQQWQQQAAQLHIRLPVIWQGDSDKLLNTVRQLLTEHPVERLYWIGEQAPAGAIALNTKQNYQLLGSECNMLVINAFSGFPADVIAASAGCVKAGGIWLLLCPPFNEWQQLPNQAHSNLLPYPIDATSHQGHFVRFWLKQLQQQNVIVIDDDSVIQQLNWPAPPVVENVPGPYITAGQSDAVAAILHVVRGHRRRPLVLTADRGRGKSAALGIAAAELAKTGKQILLTAPSPQTAQTAVRHFQQLTDTALHHQLQFVPFDQLLRGDNNADLLLVDEAAAIPTPVLQQLLLKFSRIVFATTEHGYEGTGRGFQLRFQQYLTTQCPGWKKCHIQQPVRYQLADPLELLTFNGFLLKQTSDDADYTPDNISVVSYRADDWLANPTKLQQVFGLLSLAHYQTQVKDLAALLDNPQLQVITLEQGEQLVACALISVEGQIDPTLATQIYHGERRVQGHLLAQSLAFHLAQPELATTLLWRVMRIAVQPALLRRGHGSLLLACVAQQAAAQQVAYIGTSFGVTKPLLQFWQQAGYAAVRLGHSSDKASAEHSILMLQACMTKKEQLYRLQQQFSQSLYYCLQQYPQLTPELVVELASPPAPIPLTATELQQLQLFSLGKRPYELVSHLLLSWFNLHYRQLPTGLQVLLAAVLWQQRDWQTVQRQFNIVGNKAIVTHIAAQLRQVSSW